MELKLFILLLVFIVAVFPQTIEYSLSDRIIQDDEEWKKAFAFIKDQKSLRLYQQGISQASMHKILSLELPLLEELYFQYKSPDTVDTYRDMDRLPQILTHSLVKTIFTSQYFPRLSVLNLKETNIDDKYLQFLEDMKLSTSISELNLQGCFIGKKGFKYLSNIKFNNLTKLNISNTLLIEEEAVDALLVIICGEDPNKCKNDLEAINLSKTEITRDLFIKLMNRLNPDSLRSLQMSQSSLVYKKTYNEGYNFSAFELLSRKFFNLEKIDFEKCLINDQIATIFQNWTLPHLTELNLADNHLTDVGVKLWINKNNMPNLQILALVANEVSDVTILHLVDEDYQFIKFYFGYCRITIAGSETFSKLKTSKLKELHLQIPMSSRIFDKFIKNGDFDNLKQLLIVDNDLLTNAWTQISWEYLNALRTLTISDCSIKDSFQRLISKMGVDVQAISQNLENLILNEVEFDDETVLEFLYVLPQLFPSLKLLIIQQQQGINAISVISQILKQIEYKEGTYLNINGLKLVKRGTQYELISVPFPQFLYYSESKQQTSFDIIYSKIPDIVQRFNFQTLEQIAFKDRDRLDIFFRTLDHAKITQLPRLTVLEIHQIVDIEFLMHEIKDISLPSLKALALYLYVPADASSDTKDIILQFLSQFKLINRLILDVTFLNEENGFLLKKELLDNLYFPTLIQMSMFQQNMEVEELQGFVRAHNQTLRALNLGHNFMEKDLFNILIEQQYILSKFSLESTSFIVKQFAIFGQVRTQFIEILILSQNDLTNEHMIALIKQNRQNGSGLLFPNLENLDLQSNDIRKQGLTALLQTGIYNLKVILLDRNSNPHFINIMLTYPTRNVVIEADQIQIYGLEDNLNPKSTLNVKFLKLKTKNFLKEDFHSLARLEFSTLKLGEFEIYNVYDCSVLLDLLKIGQWIKAITIQFKNDENGLNSSCLANTNFESNLAGIEINDNYGTTYMPEFIQRICNTSLELKYIKLLNTRLPPDFFSAIFKKTYTQLFYLALSFNYIGDKVASEIFRKSYPNLYLVDLINTQITDSTVELISRSKLPELQGLILDQNRLGTKAMNSLKQMKSNLYLLSLRQCELTGASLDIIGEFQFKNLGVLYLSNNKFSGADLLNFASNFNRKNFPRLAYVELKGMDLSKKEFDQISQALSPKQLMVQMDIPLNTARVNSAGY